MFWSTLRVYRSRMLDTIRTIGQCMAGTGGSCAVRCFPSSGSSRDKVASSAGILDSEIGLAKNLLDDSETGRPERLDDVFLGMAPKVR